MLCNEKLIKGIFHGELTLCLSLLVHWQTTCGLMPVFYRLFLVLSAATSNSANEIRYLDSVETVDL